MVASSRVVDVEGGAGDGPVVEGSPEQAGTPFPDAAAERRATLERGEAVVDTEPHVASLSHSARDWRAAGCDPPHRTEWT